MLGRSILVLFFIGNPSSNLVPAYSTVIYIKNASILESNFAACYKIMPVVVENFGHTSNGQGVVQYKLTNGNGMIVKVMTLGANITSLQVPSKVGGKVDDVVLGFDSVAGKL